MVNGDPVTVNINLGMVTAVYRPQRPVHRAWSLRGIKTGVPRVAHAGVYQDRYMQGTTRTVHAGHYQDGHYQYGHYQYGPCVTSTGHASSVRAMRHQYGPCVISLAMRHQSGHGVRTR